MTRGKNSAAVNARLRSQLQEAETARRQLEHRVRDAERSRDEAIKRLEDALDLGHPLLREAVAREQTKERELRELASQSEKWADHLRLALRDPLHYLIRTGDHPAVYMTPGLFAFCHEIFGADFYDWLFDRCEWHLNRTDLRVFVAQTPEDAYAGWTDWLSSNGKWRGMAAVNAVKDRRVASTEQPAELV